MIANTCGRARRALLASLVLIACAACQSPEERAAEAYEQAIELIEAGDTPRARVAFQKVFKNDPLNTEARAHYARYMREQGLMAEAAGQFLRLLEQEPDNTEALLAMTELAMEQYQWDIAEGHLDRAAALIPDAPDVVALQAVIEYTDAVTADDEAGLSAALATMQTATESLAILPVNRAVIDAHLRADRTDEALTALETALAHSPEDQLLHATKLLILRSLDRTDEVEAQFRTMIDVFPERRDIARQFVDWLAQADRIDTAETFMRDRAADGDVTANLELIEFLVAWNDRETALTDLDRLVDAGSAPLLFRAMRSTVAYQNGDTDEAIAELTAVIRDAEEDGSDERLDDAAGYRIALARMLDETGDRGGAEDALAPVIEQRPNLAEGAALQARFLLDKGRATGAISTLRAALGREETDPQLLMLLAEAHGARNEEALQSRMLSLAFDASGAAPAAALVYAAHLESLGREGAAIDVLTRSLSAQPQRFALLNALGEVHVRQGDWPRVQRIADQLREIDDGPAGRVAADRLDFAAMAALQPIEETMVAIEQLDPSEQDGTLGYVALVRAYLGANQPDAARRILDEGLERAPDNALLQAVSAQLFVTTGDSAAATETFRGLLEEAPDSEYLWRGLVKATQDDGDTDATLAVLDEALAAIPDSLRLTWDRAVLLHNAGRTDDAIAAYEAVLDRDAERLPAINNLASLLSTGRDDAESLARAAILAAPLEESDVPQFRNTLGWIRFRQGEIDEAIRLLVPAAADLPDDALAQIQAGEALIAAEQGERAQGFFDRALALEPDDPALAERARAGLGASGTASVPGN